MNHPVPGSRGVFIVGFERCMTSSLASYLIGDGYCSLLVPGVKEPGIFSSRPYLAHALVQREACRRPGEWLLDASVEYIHDPAAMRYIANTFSEYRIIVCLRNQIERTLSAYCYYKEFHSLPATPQTLYSWPYSWKFGDEVTRLKASGDPLAPSFLRLPPLGRYVFTALYAANREPYEHSPLLDEIDGKVESFIRESLPQTLVRELRFYQRTGRFPLLSVLQYSYFAWGLKQALTIFDPRFVLPVTLGEARVRDHLPFSLRRLLDVSAATGAFPHINESKANPVNTNDRRFAENALGASLYRDTQEVTKLASSCDVALFSSRALYHAIS